MDISVIIVNWNVRELLARCLESIHRDVGGSSAQVVVVDNNSSDGSVAMVRERFSWVTVLALEKNMGFAAANNRALGHATGKYIFFLNPDAEVTPGSLSGLIRYLDANNAVALVAPQLINPDGSFQKGSIRRDPTLGSQLILLLKLRYLFAKNSAFLKYNYVDFDPSKEQLVDQVMGAAMCMRRDALEAIGYFDERFFLWFEEVDLCLRLRAAGLVLKYIPTVKIIHHGGQSFNQALPSTKQKIYNRSARYFFYKHFGIGSACIIALTTPINTVLVYLYQVFGLHGDTIRK